MRRLTGAVAAAFTLGGIMPASHGAGDVESGWIEAVTQAGTDLELAFTIPGMVAEVLVTPGERVEAGQALAGLDAREIEAGLALMRLRAESDLAINEAQALLDLARNDLRRVEEAFARGAMSDFEVERARLEVTRREVALAKARQIKEEAALQLAQTQATRDRYVLRTPSAGVVEQVLIEAGETVQELRPVVRVVSVDPLRIDVAAPLEATLGIEVGSEVVVAWAGDGDAPEVGRGTVVHVASVADAASGTRLVRVRMANPEGAPAGARVRVRFARDGETRADASDPADAERRVE